MVGWLSESNSVTDGERSGKGCSGGGHSDVCREALKRVPGLLISGGFGDGGGD